MSNLKYSKSPKEFEKELFALIHRLIKVDGVRFNIYVPTINLNKEISSSADVDQMVVDYTNTFWLHDPMHPSLFEATKTTVISDSMLMDDVRWQATKIYKEFYKPNGYFHNADVFFRKNQRIIAVLSLIRKQQRQPFTDQEVALLENIQPFMEYCLSKVYLPKRLDDRSSLSEKYQLTSRELDVVELALTGASNKVLAEKLKVSLPTLRTHLQNIYAKVDVHSNSELISKLLTALS